MMKSRCLSFLAILFSVAACAPINYGTTYRPSSGHVSVYKPSQAYTRPIQVTLYSDSTYLGVNFQPIQIVISDGEYVEIPAKNRRGRSSRIFAHYYHGNLHFDGNRKCQKLQGSTGYQYDRRWDKGHKYTHVNAGYDYDFTGLRLVIRNTPANSRSGKALPTTTPKIHKKTLNTTKYQLVKHNNKKSIHKKVVAHKQLKDVKSNVVVATKTFKPIKHTSSVKHLDAIDKTRVNRVGKAQKRVVPDIVREVSRHDKADKAVVTVRKNGLELTGRPASKRSVAAQAKLSGNEIKRQQTKAQRKSVNAKPDLHKAIPGEGINGRATVPEKAKDVQSIQKKASRAQGQKKLVGKAKNKQGTPEVFVMDYPQERDKHAKVKKDR